jgi:uridine kinase
VLPLDNFYFDHDRAGLPRRFGIVDWDDPATWDAAGALAALTELCDTGRAEIPDYDIPTSTRVGAHEVKLGKSHLVIAEGVFAAELVVRCRDAGLLAAAICLRRRRFVTFGFRLVRDLTEARKPVWTLVRRGIGLYRQEPALIAKWVALGCEPMGITQAETKIAALTQ